MSKYNILIWIGLLMSVGVTGLTQQDQQVPDSIGLELELGVVLITDHLDHKVYSFDEIADNNEYDVSKALGKLPSFILATSGQRNEGLIYLRGFDLRGVPVMVDGIPVYAPFDGYVDLDRFTIADLSKIEISKGNASVLFGPNTIGGAINLVSRKPLERFELDALAGIASGGGKQASLYVGSRRKHFYFQGNLAYLEKDFVRLPASFDTSYLENDWKLDNSWRKDYKVRAKVGYTPGKNGDEYTLNYIYQHGEKGNPVYLGDDPQIQVRYWQWPYWDKQSIYFVGKTALAGKTILKSRFFVDQFKNRLESYDDASYTEQTRGYAFTSLYNDLVWGAKLELNDNHFDRHFLNVSLQLKNDLHRENNLGEPIRHFRDITYSFGIEDEVSVSKNLNVVPGWSYHLRQSLKADDYDASSETISSFPLKDSDVMNYQLAISWKITDDLNMALTGARKSRFATLDDRFSYRLGRAIPNPELKAEQSYNLEWNLEYAGVKGMEMESSLFLSNLFNTIQLVNEVQPGIEQLQNTGEALFYGLDLAVTWKKDQKWELHTHYSFIDQENRSNPELKFINVPKHKLFAKLDLQPLDGLTIGIAGEYNSKRFSTSYGTIAHAFYLVHLQAEMSLSRRFGIRLGINNLLDAWYERIEGYPGEGRNGFVSVVYYRN